MGKRERQRSKLDREAVEEADRIGARATAAPPSIHIISSDDEANEDLTLRIVEKALLMRAVRLGRDNNAPGDDGVVSLDPPRAGGGAREVEKKGPSTKKVVVKIKKVVKKVVKKKKEITDQKVVATVDDEEEEDKQPETTTAEIVPEPNPVEDSDNIVLRNLLRGPRYFDPPDSSWGACYNCGESGHMAVDCTSARRKKPCFVCGSFEHNVKQCTKGQDCFICKKMGHRARDCPEKYKSCSIDSKICLKCGDSGHDMFLCRNDYYADDFKEVSCYVCKKLGHLCCGNFDNSCPKNVSCYRCGQLGHTGLSCNRLYGETTVTDSPSSCYKCGEEGHFARECHNSSKNTKRVREPSTPNFNRSEREPKQNKGHKFAPHDLGKSPKKKKSHHKENGNTTPKKQKHRGGWLTEDPRDYSHDRSRNSGHRIGYFTPSGHVQTPQSSSRHSRHGYKTPHFHAEPPPNGLYHYQNGADSGSRFGYHGSGSNGWSNRSHGW